MSSRGIRYVSRRVPFVVLPILAFGIGALAGLAFRLLR